VTDEEQIEEWKALPEEVVEWVSAKEVNDLNEKSYEMGLMDGQVERCTKHKVVLDRLVQAVESYIDDGDRLKKVIGELKGMI